MAFIGAFIIPLPDDAFTTDFTLTLRGWEPATATVVPNNSTAVIIYFSVLVFIIIFSF